MKCSTLLTRRDAARVTRQPFQNELSLPSRHRFTDYVWRLLSTHVHMPINGSCTCLAMPSLRPLSTRRRRQSTSVSPRVWRVHRSCDRRPFLKRALAATIANNSIARLKPMHLGASKQDACGICDCGRVCVHNLLKNWSSEFCGYCKGCGCRHTNCKRLHGQQFCFLFRLHCTSDYEWVHMLLHYNSKFR